MKIQIHQIQPEKDGKHLCFMNYEYVMKHNEGIIPKSIYDCVFTGAIEADNLEDVFRIFNIEHPKDYTGRSLSVSDVVEIQYEDKSEFFFCDSIGFKMIVFDKSLIGCDLIKTVHINSFCKCCAECKYYSENSVCKKHKLGVSERNFCDGWESHK